MRGKRNIHRKPVDIGFVRKADGSLRPAQEGQDIKDIWADLDRIKLKDAIEHDQKKRRRKERRRGMFQAIKASGKPGAVDDGTKTVEIKINFPGVSLTDFFRSAKAKVQKLPFNWKHYAVVTGLVLLVVLFVASFSLYGDGTKPRQEGSKTASAVAGISDSPPYQTVLPINKSISELGGWKRVSPPDKDPVYAFNDQIDNVAITVSQQPLPDSFKENTGDAIAKLAQQFSANDKLTAGETQAYVGTDVSGPQSIILTKNGLLILAKSAAKLTNTQWEQYLATLQ